MRRLAISVVIGLIGAGSAAAQDDGQGNRPALLNDLLACRAQTEAVARLACFDAMAEAFDRAEQQGEVTVIDRAVARETRTRLFGLDLATANLFGSLRRDDAVESIETTLTSARQTGRGEWVFVLADGSTWRQIDGERVSARVVPGAAVRIRQGAMGSYLLSVSGARSVRARRER